MLFKKLVLLLIFFSMYQLQAKEFRLLKPPSNIKNSNFNKQSKLSEALFRAVKNSQADAVLYLINKGVDVNATSDAGGTALIYAAIYNKTFNILKILLKAGADVHIISNAGGTALIYAAIYNSNPEVLKVLLKAGADVHAINKHGHTALDYAKKYNTPTIIAILKQWSKK